MKKILLIFTLLTLSLFANFFADMSFSYKHGKGNVDKNFVRNDKNGTVEDLKTHLIYYDAKPSKKMIYSDAVAYCENMDYLGHKDWKLPTIEQLKAITELSRRELYVKHAFKNIQEGIYWASTKDRYDEAWYVDFDLGRWNTASYDHQFYALCVRQGK